jgi:ketosteroid isomerase-like protein
MQEHAVPGAKERYMADQSIREHARRPQDLERLLVARQWAGEVSAMAALYEADAVVDCADGRLLEGREAIREYFAEYAASGRKFQSGAQQPAVISGDLALTSTRLPDGTVTAEVARRQPDGTWLWVIDRFAIARESK